MKKALIPFAFALSILVGCGGGTPPGVTSHLEGTLRVRGDVETTGDYRDFILTVVNQLDGNVDTLATATTDSLGTFSMTVHAPEAGIYPLIVERAGQQLALEELVVVDGDSVSVSGTFPLGNRRLIIRSPENAAWAAYRNTRGQHNQQMNALVRGGTYTANELRQLMEQSSTILWSVAGSYPGTMGAKTASAESVIMLEGWNDSLVVSRYQEVPADSPIMVDMIRAVRRSVAREAGQDSALAVIRSYVERADSDEHKAALRSEIVIALADSGQTDLAVREATELRRLHPDSDWAEWASRASYDLENLQPGMPSPAFDLVSREAEPVRLSDLTGTFVILEFYDPMEDGFRRNLPARNALYSALPDELFSKVSVSVEPDSVLNDGMFDEGNHPGTFVYAPDGLASDVARAFNVNVIPTRFLIDPDGNIMAKYVGSSLSGLEQDLVSVINGLNELARRNQE